MLSSASLTNLAEPEPEPEQLGSPSSTRGLAYSLPLRCVSVDSDGKTLRASGSLDGTTSVGVLPSRTLPTLAVWLERPRPPTTPPVPAGFTQP